MSELSVKEVRKKKDKLADDISRLIRVFIDETGMLPDVDIQQTKFVGGNCCVRVEVKLEL